MTRVAMMMAMTWLVACGGGDEDGAGGTSDTGHDHAHHDDHDDDGSDDATDAGDDDTDTSTDDTDTQTDTDTFTTDGGTTTTDTGDSSTTPVAEVWTGSFMPADYPASGTATLEEDNGAWTLRFDNFSTSAGPDLKVYLSTDTGDSDYVDLGDLKGISGSANYAVPAGFDPNVHDHVLIWCEAFGVLFGYAVLTP